MTRRQFLAALASAASAAAVGCALKNNHLSVLGYTTEPQFDPCLRSVSIPTFKLGTLVTSEQRGIDVHLTEALVNELGARKCPIRVVSDPTRADTELVGTISRVQKNKYSGTQQNLTLEGEIIVTVDILWRDLRTGEVLTNPRTPSSTQAAPVFDPTAPPQQGTPPNSKPTTVAVTATGRYVVQLGESNQTGADMACKRIAAQIVNMMERPWNTN